MVTHTVPMVTHTAPMVTRTVHMASHTVHMAIPTVGVEDSMEAVHLIHMVVHSGSMRKLMKRRRR
jgi:hypothetical protein